MEISVQPRTTAGPFHMVDDLPVPRCGCFQNGAMAEFLVNDSVDIGAFLIIGNGNFEVKSGFQAPAIEMLFHGEARRQKPDFPVTGLDDRLAGRVRNVENRKARAFLDLVGELVHRVGGNHKKRRAAGLQRTGSVDEDAGALAPFSLMLELLDAFEIDRMH